MTWAVLQLQFDPIYAEVHGQLGHPWQAVQDHRNRVPAIQQLQDRLRVELRRLAGRDRGRFSVDTEPMLRRGPTRFEDFGALPAFFSAPVAAVCTSEDTYTRAGWLDRREGLAQAAQLTVEIVPANIPELVVCMG